MTIKNGKLTVMRGGDHSVVYVNGFQYFVSVEDDFSLKNVYPPDISLPSFSNVSNFSTFLAVQSYLFSHSMTLKVIRIHIVL